MSYIAMNRFEVVSGKEEAFEDVWRNRQSYLDEVPGFIEFHLLKGEDGVYLSHALWADEASFKAWTESESFRAAHASGASRGMLKGPPQLGLYHVVI